MLYIYSVKFKNGNLTTSQEVEAQDTNSAEALVLMEYPKAKIVETICVEPSTIIHVDFVTRKRIA